MTEKIKITFFGDTLGCAAQFEPNGVGLAIGQWGEDAEGRHTLTLTRDFGGGLKGKAIDDELMDRCVATLTSQFSQRLYCREAAAEIITELRKRLAACQAVSDIYREDAGNKNAMLAAPQKQDTPT